MSHIIGVDVGGTFTDLVAVDRATGELTLLKVPSDPDRPDRAVVEAVRRSGLPAHAIERLVHGSTVSTNAILERKGARVGLLTTAGFEDVLEIGHGDRAHLYDLSWSKPEPLVPRHRRLGVTERMDSRGRELVALDGASVEAATRQLLADGAEAIAVCFLHAYANPAHERAARAIVERVAPGVPVSISSEVMNAIREFERTSTVVVDAYVKPVMGRYLGRLEASLAEAGLGTPVQVMQSSGGVMTAQDCAELPVHTLLSGPAGGVIAAQHLAAASGHVNVITFDIGGTSADAAFIEQNGRPHLTTETEVDWGIPVQVPMIDIRTIGAGGGSIAWLDPGGRLKVGPRSAGARPGPACFGLGGTQPTVTDANLVLGYLSPDYYAGGTFPLDPDLAARAITDRIARPLGLDLTGAARGILAIIDANMRNLIRQISVQQGHDPRGHALMAFGGGGPVHAVSLARELGIRTVLIPATPGVLSAYGLLLAVPRHDFVGSLPRPLHQLDRAELDGVLAGMEERGRRLLERAGVTTSLRVEMSLDMQYERQNYTLNVPLTPDIRTVEAIRAAFAQAYERKYGYLMAEQPITLVSCRVSVAGEADRAARSADQLTRAGGAAHGPTRTRPVFFEAWGAFQPCPVVHRNAFRPGMALPSPCIVEQPDTSIVIPPGVAAEVDATGMIELRLDGRA